MKRNPILFQELYNLNAFLETVVDNFIAHGALTGNVKKIQRIVSSQQSSPAHGSPIRPDQASDQVKQSSPQLSLLLGSPAADEVKQSSQKPSPLLESPASDQVIHYRTQDNYHRLPSNTISNNHSLPFCLGNELILLLFNIF